MEIIKAMCLDWLLFNILESWLLLYYVQHMMFNYKIKIIDWITLSFIMTFATQFTPPMVRQLIFIIFIFLITWKYTKYIDIKHPFKISILVFAVWFIVESGYAIFLNKILNIYLEDFTTFKLFLWMLPIKILEYIIAYIGGDILMKAIWGNIKKGK